MGQSIIMRRQGVVEAHTKVCEAIEALRKVKEISINSLLPNSLIQRLRQIERELFSKFINSC